MSIFSIGQLNWDMPKRKYGQLNWDGGLSRIAHSSDHTRLDLETKIKMLI